jgi:hypothetical protein
MIAYSAGVHLLVCYIDLNIPLYGSHHIVFITITIYSKFHSRKNYEQIEVRECLLSLGAESFVLQFGVQKYKVKTYRTIILSVVMYGCETWSHTLREERRLRFENRVLWRILWSKRDKVTGEWKRLHNEELNDLYSSPNSV